MVFLSLFFYAGSVSYLDFLNPEVRSYWASQFLPDKYQGEEHSRVRVRSMVSVSVSMETMPMSSYPHTEGHQLFSLDVCTDHMRHAFLPVFLFSFVPPRL